MAVTENIAIAFPESAQKNPEAYAIRCKELGFDALVFGFYDSKQEGEVYKGSLEWMQTFKKHDVSLIIKPHCSANHVHQLPFNDAIFWESSLQSQTQTTQFDLVREELRFIESQIGKKTKLIFYIPFDAEHPKRQARWLSKLCDEAGHLTTIAFSTHCGQFWSDHLPLHPFWEELAQAPDCSETALLPIINSGLVEKGDGRWPNIPFDLFDRISSRWTRHNFKGPLAIASHLPGYGGALECSLFLGVHLKNTELHSAAWLKSNHPHVDFESWRRLMAKGREITLEAGAKYPSKELSRLQIESLISRLKFEEELYEREQISLFPYFAGFAFDIRKELKLPNSGVQNSFWETEEGKKILDENFFI